MFDTALPTPEALRSADDATVVAAIEQWARAEAAAAARRLDAIAELARRRADDNDTRAYWSCDSWDAAAAEVAAALAISQGRASGQMELALTLRDRFPQVGALFMAGEISYRLASLIEWRTHLVQDDEALRLIDTALAKRSTEWGPLSVYKTEQAIDFWIERYDPGALRRTRATARSRNVQIGTADDHSGTAAMVGRLYATDAALLDRRLMQMARDVCEDDPRTIAQRRADALGALAAGAERLACTCDNPECPAAVDDKRASGVVIHVVTESSALDAQPDPAMSGETPPQSEPDGPSKPSAGLSAGVIVGGGVVPTPLLAELIRSGAKVLPIRQPCDVAPKAGYSPSAALEDFVRARDLTCRFPGCDRPAVFCDIDHTLPWPLGHTHASNLKCLCRKHHLLKTFWTGIGGWADIQLPDGTVIWTSPTGRTYTTRPGGRIFFPAWPTATTKLAARCSTPVTTLRREIMMPTKRRTHAAEQARRIRAERALNDADVAERNIPPPF